jgi:hypothetical protein
MQDMAAALKSDRSDVERHASRAGRSTLASALRHHRVRRSMRLYARLGFVPIQETPAYIEMEWNATA